MLLFQQDYYSGVDKMNEDNRQYCCGTVSQKSPWIPIKVRSLFRAKSLGLFFLVGMMGAPVQAQTRNVRSAASATSVDGVKGQLQLTERRSLVLGESMVTLGEISSIAALDGDGFVVASKEIAAVVKYDALGKQQAIIGGWGEGPFEYTAPSTVRYNGDHLVVLDERDLSFLVFDESGTGVEEWNGFSTAMSDFQVQEDVLSAYTNGSFEHLVMVVDRANSDTTLYASGSMLHSAILSLNGTGKIGARGSEVFYAYPDKAELHRVDIRSGKEVVVLLDDPDFRADQSRLPVDDFDKLNEALFDGTLIDYLSNNSVVYGVVALKDYVVVQIEDKTERKTETSNGRVTKYFVLDYDLNPIDHFILGHEVRSAVGDYHLGSYGNSLLFAHALSNSDGSSIEWKFTELEIAEN